MRSSGDFTKFNFFTHLCLAGIACLLSGCLTTPQDTVTAEISTFEKKEITKIAFTDFDTYSDADRLVLDRPPAGPVPSDGPKHLYAGNAFPEFDRIAVDTGPRKTMRQACDDETGRMTWNEGGGLGFSMNRNARLGLNVGDSPEDAPYGIDGAKLEFKYTFQDSRIKPDCPAPDPVRRGL